MHALDGGHGPALAVAPDGTRFVRHDDASGEPAALVVRDLHTAGDALELDGSAGSPAWRLRLSPDATMVAAAAADDDVAVWDATSGTLLFTESVRALGVVDVAFAPDSAQLTVTTGDWLIASYSTETWEPVAERELFVDGGYQLGLAGYAGDGALLAVGAFQANAAGALHWLDPVTLQATRSQVNVHEGSIRAVALDSSGARLATGSADGVLRVWDTASGDLVHEVPFGGAALEGVAFAGGDRVAVTLAGGNIVLVTTDPVELLELVRGSLTRGFTLPECARFTLGEDCPTLAELGAPIEAGGAPDVLAGTYRVDWPEEDVGAELIARAEDYARGALSSEWAAALGDFAEELAGSYTLMFDGGRFDIALDSMDETYCTGTYTIRDDRVWLHAERGWCVEYLLFDAAFTVTDDALSFDGDDFRGDFPHQVVFASHPLERVA